MLDMDGDGGTLSPRHGSDHEERLDPGDHGVRQTEVGGLVGQVPLASEVPDERPAFMCDVVPDGAPEHRITGLEGIQDRTLRDGPRHVQRDLGLDPRQGSEVRWQDDPDEAGQLFPPSAERKSAASSTPARTTSGSSADGSRCQTRLNSQGCGVPSYHW